METKFHLVGILAGSSVEHYACDFDCMCDTDEPCDDCYNCNSEECND